MTKLSPEQARAKEVMDSLQPFQRATVDHVVNRLWHDDDATDRFLVADEVGLGKTMVAKGVIAQAVAHLAPTQRRVDVVYICSNGAIARQNLSRLNVVDGSELSHADRLTLLPKVMGQLTSGKVNFVSFTPGTSFHVANSGGKWEERVLLYWMLRTAWGADEMSKNRWKQFFRGGVRRDNFERYLANFDRNQLDAESITAFAEAIENASGPCGRALREELEECSLRYRWLRGNPPFDLRAQTEELVGALRRLVAHVSVGRLEPDLVIFDEFQRFKTVLSGQDEGARLARRLYSSNGAKVLMLSATPYKMYTLPDEPDGEDHHEDFLETIDFLASDRVPRIRSGLETMRRVLLGQEEREVGQAARDVVQRELRRVMARTERHSAAEDSMLVEKQHTNLAVTVNDLHRYRALAKAAEISGSHDVFEYWRSTPYLFNLMDKGSYQAVSKLEAAIDRGEAGLSEILRPEVLLSREKIQKYERLDAANAKMRALMADLDAYDVWRLAWLPPSMPYYRLGDEYARAAEFTKRLVFSAWNVVPKAISTMVSYDAERQAIAASEFAGTEREYNLPYRSSVFVFPPPRVEESGQVRYASMPALAALYPSTTLARLGDPLEIARAHRADGPLTIEEITEIVAARISTELENLPDNREGPRDERWYWAAPFLLDKCHGTAEGMWESMRRWKSETARTEYTDDEAAAAERSGHAAHVTNAEQLDGDSLGSRPDDLARVLAQIAIAGPGVAALRALSRVCGGRAALGDDEIRERAFRIAHEVGALFNKHEIGLLLRTEGGDTRWREVIDHCLRGGLQPVLDEYAHVLVESEGLQDSGPHGRADRLAEAMIEALGIRTAQNRVRQIAVENGAVKTNDDQRVRTHIAARYGSGGEGGDREATVRAAFNSPFRPFVLASTSVGQEGLDFHTYAHAVVHWNLPSNPVDLEQREGRVHRYKGHAIRKNAAASYAEAAFNSGCDDPWAAVFKVAEDEASSRPGGTAGGLIPYWVYTGQDEASAAKIERYVPAMPLSREVSHYERLKRTMGAYRLVMGQPRQEDLVKYVAAAGNGAVTEGVDWLAIDLAPYPEFRR